MNRVSSFVQGWFAEPPPTWEFRKPGARWTTGHRAPRRHRLHVARVVQETPTSRTFFLSDANGDPPSFEYLAGQHLTLLLEVGGKSLRRCYSFSSAPESGSLPAITVRRIEGGLVSARLHDTLEPGDTLVALDPSGSFTLDSLPETAPRLVLVAGGVGITPLISIAESTLRRLPASSVVMLCGHRRREEIVFRERLDALASEFGPRLSLHCALEEAPTGWTGLRGRLDGRQVLDVLGTATADLYYVCGPEPMMDSVCGALAAAGIPRDRVRTERFAYADPRKLQLPEAAAEFVLAQSGRRLSARPGQTLLQAGLDAGVDLPYSCTMGGCGACKVRRTAGKVVMVEPNCLSEVEREAGYILACCSYGDGRVVIENL